MDLTELEVCLDGIVEKQCDSADIIELFTIQAAEKATLAKLTPVP